MKKGILLVVMSFLIVSSLSYLSEAANACTGSQPSASTNWSIGADTACNYNITNLGAFNITGISTNKILIINNSDFTLEAIKPSGGSSYYIINSSVKAFDTTKPLYYTSPFTNYLGVFNSTIYGFSNPSSTGIDPNEQIYMEYTVLSNSTGRVFQPQGGMLNLYYVNITNYTNVGTSLIEHTHSNVSISYSRIYGNGSASYSDSANKFFSSNNGLHNITFYRNYVENWKNGAIIWLNKGRGGGTDIVNISENVIVGSNQLVYGNTGANDTYVFYNNITGDSNGYCIQANDDNHKWYITGNRCVNKTRGFYGLSGTQFYYLNNYLSAIWDGSHAGVTYDRINDSWDRNTYGDGVNRACVLNSENSNTSTYNLRCYANTSLNNITSGYGAEMWEGSGSNYYVEGPRGISLDYAFNWFPSSVEASFPCENATLINGSAPVTGSAFFKPAFVGVVRNLDNTFNRGCGHGQFIDMNCSSVIRGNQGAGFATCFKFESTYDMNILRGLSNNTERLIWINYQANKTRIVNHTFGSNFSVAQIYIENTSFATVINPIGLNMSNITVFSDAMPTSKVFVGQNWSVQLNWSNGTAISTAVQWNYTDYDLKNSNYNLVNFTTDANGAGNTEMPSYLVNQSGIFNFTITINATYNDVNTTLSFIPNNSNMVQLILPVPAPTPPVSAPTESNTGGGASSGNTVSSPTIINSFCPTNISLTLPNGTLVCVSPCDGTYVVNVDSTISCIKCPAGTGLVNNTCVTQQFPDSLSSWEALLPKDRPTTWVVIGLSITFVYLILTSNNKKRSSKWG